MTDTELLDALQKTTTGHGNGWVLRESGYGRGMRLHETTRAEGTPNVRDAIMKHLMKPKIED